MTTSEYVWANNLDTANELGAEGWTVHYVESESVSVWSDDKAEYVWKRRRRYLMQRKGDE